jgi:3-isopropylmalate dehydratase small subunit
MTYTARQSEDVVQVQLDAGHVITIVEHQQYVEIQGFTDEPLQLGFDDAAAVAHVVFDAAWKHRGRPSITSDTPTLPQDG